MEADRGPRNMERVLAGNLLTTSPTRVTEWVNILDVVSRV